MFRSRRVWIGIAATAVMLVIAIFGRFLAPFAPSDVIGTPYADPSSASPLGTDYLGQDVLSRVLWGGWSVVWMSVTATSLAVVVGALLGLTAAYAGGWFDTLVVWLNDVLMAFPLIVFVILFVSMLGRDPLLVVVSVSFAWLPTVVRLTRSVALAAIQQDYVASAEIIGTPRWRILAGEILPNITGPLIVQTGALLTWSVGLIAGLSFLGFGIQSPNADWGLMVNENRSGLAIAPWATILPIVCIAAFALATNTLAEAVGRVLGRRTRRAQGKPLMDGEVREGATGEWVQRSARASVDVLAVALGHPEGPDLRSDGGLLFVEARSGRVCVHYPGQGVATFASTGGSPYGCTLGSDGSVYVTQSGNANPALAVPRPVPPSIQRLSPDGSVVEVLVDQSDGIDLGMPNDLAWGADGRLYFTDSGRFDSDGEWGAGYLHAVRPDGIAEVVLELGSGLPNGVAVESDGGVIWLESYSRVVGRLKTDGTSEIVTVLPHGHSPEGVKIAQDGSLWITNFEAGGIDVIERDGTPRESIDVGGVPVNCVFGDGWIYVMDYGHAADESEDSLRPGRVIRVPVQVEGLPLRRGFITTGGGFR